MTTTSRKDPQQPDPRPGNGCHTDTLLVKGPMGEISICSAGCLHIDTPSISIRLTEQDFLRVVGMFTTAATTLMTMRASAAQGQVQ